MFSNFSDKDQDDDDDSITIILPYRPRASICDVVDLPDLNPF